ncbi:DMT family transporter [Paraglaciecola chathamensis]|uniref:EamA domain-containing protein n=1 Tax=Paraglaciecola chathamensis S18K6 TaxID=1127672 RepID=A0AAV3V7F7_9ALTE|nr:DMT family transporter [Paraglaciecola chathamensis]GAC12552.1 hypothetical protein GCHA_4635 [Paraglaciecola chathamensis S18K6]
MYMKIQQTHIANILLLAVTLLAASGWLFSKFVLIAMSPMFFLAIRFIGSGLMVGAMKPIKVIRTPMSDCWRALLTGTVLGVQTALWGFALAISDGLGVGAFLISLSFLLIPITGLLFGFRAQGHTWLAVAIAMPGLFLLALRHGLTLADSDILFLLSAILYAFYFNINGRLCHAIPAITQTCYQLIAAGTVCFIAFLSMEIDFNQSVYGVWHWLALSIVLATCLRFFLLLKAQSMSPEGQGAIVMTLEPVWVAILSAWWLNEKLSLVALLGMGLIFLALVVNAVGSIRASRKRKQLVFMQGPAMQED